MGSQLNVVVTQFFLVVFDLISERKEQFKASPNIMIGIILYRSLFCHNNIVHCGHKLGFYR